MKKSPTSFCFSLFTLFITINILLSSTLFAQIPDARHIESSVTQSDAEFNIYFLASDEFLGRDTGTQELQIASRYLATWFQTHGIQQVEGTGSYFQEVPFRRTSAPDDITLAVGDSTFTLNRHLIAINSKRGEIEAPLIILEHASRDELDGHDIEGKIIVAKAGLPGQSSPQEILSGSEQKRGWIAEAGGAGLIELYTHHQFPWQVLVNFLGGERLSVADPNDDETGETIFHLRMNAVQSDVKNFLAGMSGEPAMLAVTGKEPESFKSRNVIGVIEGTDPDLKDEYLLLSAHYDHLGVVQGQTTPFSGEHIYNGARDNAVGTAGVLAAGKYLAQNPPRRSVILAAWTAEEKGLLGSRWYSEHPMIPLQQTIFNLNIDGAGYNDTTMVTVIGLGRTEADEHIIAAADAFGLEAVPDPVPEQNLFDRSDNVHFARNGVPAPTYSMGFTAFDEEISRYYHQVTDEPHTLDYEYITRYIRSYVLAAAKIANTDEAPFWLPGDVYEEAGLELYGLE